ncbi:MAG: glycosyltransferase family 2 protein [Erythrobacter sp.]
MSLLAVIPCLNEASHLPALLRQMLADPTIDRIVVADGGSDDGSREIVRQFSLQDRVTLLDNPARIQSAGVNRAVREYGGGYTWLLRIDAHCLYPDNYARSLLEAAKAHDASAVVVPMVTVGKKGFQRAAAAAQNSVLGTGGSAHRHLGQGCFVEHGHHALMDIDLFRTIGGYCEAMACNEDAELDYRQIAAGGAIWLEPSLALTYFPRSTIGALWRQYRRYGQGRARNLRRHRMRPRLRQLVPLAVPVAMLLLLFSWVHPVLAVPALAWAVLCIGLGLVIGARAGGGWALLAGVAAMTMQLAWAIGFLIEWFCAPASASPRYGFAPQVADPPRPKAAQRH